MKEKRLARVLLLVLALCCLGAEDTLAQQDLAQAVLVATLADVHASLVKSSDALITGPVAFDPRILRASHGPAPARWPDSLTLKWEGHARGSTLPTEAVRSVVDDVNGSRGPVRWLACGSAPAARSCSLIEFPAVIAVSEPWISGDSAQVLVLEWYRSSIRLHPYAWAANVVRLRRVEGRWTVTHWHNQAGT